MDSMNRRTAIGIGMGAALGAIGGPLSARNASPTVLQQNSSASFERTLTVKELPPEEWAALLQVNKEAMEAQARAWQADCDLKAKYGNVVGVDVTFEQGYVFIRDFRSQLSAKETAELAFGSQAMCQAQYNLQGR